MVYCVSDIHGQFAAFLELLELIAFQPPADHMYILGDIIDRGPESVELLAYLKGNPAFTVIKGNHEQFLSDYVVIKGWSEDNNYYYNTYGQMMERLPEVDRDNYIDWLERLPYQVTVKCNGKRYLLAHGATVDGSEPVDKWEILMPDEAWYTEHIAKPPVEGCISVVGHYQTRDLRALLGQASNGKIWRNESSTLIDIDCGAAYPEEGGYLACLRLDDEQEFYALVKGNESNMI